MEAVPGNVARFRSFVNWATSLNVMTSTTSQPGSTYKCDVSELYELSKYLQLHLHDFINFCDVLLTVTSVGRKTLSDVDMYKT